jgi:hypothetical protein
MIPVIGTTILILERHIMSEIIRHAETCQVKMAKSSKLTEAVVAQFEFEKTLNVVINKAVKISMKWNGKCYEGRSAGMDFESSGPAISKTKTGIRG